MAYEKAGWYKSDELESLRTQVAEKEKEIIDLETEVQMLQGFKKELESGVAESRKAKQKRIFRCRLDEMQCSEECHGNIEKKEKCEFCTIEYKDKFDEVKSVVNEIDNLLKGEIVPPEKEWISVKERLPEVDECVQVWRGRFGWTIAKRRDVGGTMLCHFDGESKYTYENPTHWMPVPKSPETV
jgi:hypothetical protein